VGNLTERKGTARRMASMLIGMRKFEEGDSRERAVRGDDG
jgi:hypothetical protein